MRKTQNYPLDLIGNVHESSIFFNTPQNFISKSRAVTELRPGVRKNVIITLRVSAAHRGQSTVHRHVGSGEAG